MVNKGIIMSTDPKTFHVQSVSESGIQTSWMSHLSNKNQPEIKMCIPPEFEGPGDGYSPEDLYGLALLNCFIATFKFVAEKSRLEFKNITGNAELTVGLGDKKSPWMQKLEISILLSGAPQAERALNLMEKTKKNCMIINSVNTEVIFHFQVEA
jgi:organic hydroperoxide reductase OsmC/OhrA